MAGVNLLVFIAGYGLSILLTRRGAAAGAAFSAGHATLATMPLYWLLMSAAAWLALWQFMTAPFHWNKTEHGLSRLQGRGLPRRRGRFRRPALRDRG